MDQSNYEPRQITRPVFPVIERFLKYKAAIAISPFPVTMWIVSL